MIRRDNFGAGDRTPLEERQVIDYCNCRLVVENLDGYERTFGFVNKSVPDSPEQSQRTIGDEKARSMRSPFGEM